MLKKLMQTSDSGIALLLRLTLGIVMLPHGLQKTFGLFGGYGFSGTMGYLTQQLHIPTVFAVLAIVAEFAGSFGLLLGFLTRIAAFGILCNMVVAVLLIHQHVGFMMNWAGQYPAGQEGLEYHLLASGIALALIVLGGGKASVDRAITK